MTARYSTSEWKAWAKRELARDKGLLKDWKVWLRTLFGQYLKDARGRDVPFGPHHVEFWEWLWKLEKGVSPDPFVGIWSRGGAKSTSAELACVALAALEVRRYGLYVCGSQEQSDDHLGNVGGMFESSALSELYPAVGERLVGKYGNAKGWRRNRLRTVGFTLDAIGLDTASRGVKLDEFRPDFMVIDDIDSTHDTADTVQKKIKTLTKALLPAGSTDLAVLAIQNLVHEGSVFSLLQQRKVDFLTNAIVSGPIPALEEMAYEQRDGRYVIVAGEPTWAGQDRAACQVMVDRFGISAFKEECQHEVDEPAGGMFDHLTYRHCKPDDVPDLIKVVVWVDPAVTDSARSDSHGIQCDGIALDGRIYRLWSWEGHASPEASLERAICKGIEYGASTVGVETDQGGDTWDTVFGVAMKRIRTEIARQALDNLELGPIASGPGTTAWYQALDRIHAEIRGQVVPIAQVLAKHGLQKREDEEDGNGKVIDLIRQQLLSEAGNLIQVPAFDEAKAGQGYGPKVHRASQMVAAYETDKFVHVLGTHATLERALRRFPKKKPYDLVDCAFWSFRYLAGSPHKILPLHPPMSASGGWSAG